MKFELEYGFNNGSMPKFEEYEIKTIKDIKYVVPKLNESTIPPYTSINFEDYEENDKPLIDFINLGKLSLENKEDIDTLLIKFVNTYGLLGLIHNLPVNKYYTLDKKVLLKEFNNVSGIEYYDCFNTIDIVDYFKIFFPTATDKQIKQLLIGLKNSLNNNILI